MQGRFKAWTIGLGVVVYFAATTVWLPSALLTGPLVASSRVVQDSVATGVWIVFLLAGMWALRRAQGRGWL